VAGGIRIAEVGVELAVAAAIYSSRTGIALKRNEAIAGELSLAGEVLPVRRLANRIKAAGSLGFTLVTAKDLKSAVTRLFADAGTDRAEKNP
jgi:DNA repair protein RadA/Sms